jgi:hypothetical protein
MQNSGFRGLPALDLQGEHIWVEQNVITGGGIWLRDGTDTVAIAHNTITRGHTQGILLGGLRDGEDLVVSRSGVRAVDIVDNEISVMAREGISTLVFGGERVGDVVEISIQGNTITQCGIAPIVEGLALGGGIFIRDGADILIHDNTIIENGPFENSEERFAIGFGVAVVMCVGLDVQDNRIADNGRAVGPGDEGINLNAGIAGLGVFSAQRGFDDAPELDGPAAVVHGNVIGVAEGPGVFMFGLGPISIDDNEITCRYPGRGLIDYGRAVMAINMGAAPDIGVAQIAGKEVSWPFLHGRISAVGNQISVQGRAYGLPPWDPEFNSVTSPVAQSRLGSAVALYSFDDVLIDGNQIVNEMRPAGDGRGRIRSSVWASASTIRTTTNRLTELPFTALHSYVGNGAAHNASDNISTHCVRVEGTNTVNRDNIEIFCLRLVPIPVPIRFHAFIGG